MNLSLLFLLTSLFQELKRNLTNKLQVRMIEQYHACTGRETSKLEQSNLIRQPQNQIEICLNTQHEQRKYATTEH